MPSSQGKTTTTSAPEIEVSTVSDLHSRCKALIFLNPEVDPLRQELNWCTANVTIQWVPCRAGMAGNKPADKAARETSNLGGFQHTAAYKRAYGLINNHLRESSFYAHTQAAYKHFLKDRERKVKSREGQRTIVPQRTRNTTMSQPQFKLTQLQSTTLVSRDGDPGALRGWDQTAIQHSSNPIGCFTGAKRCTFGP